MKTTLPLPPQAVIRPRPAVAALWRWPVLVLLLGLVLTALTTRALHNTQDAVARSEFDRLSERISVETERRLDLPLYGLKGARGVYATGAQLGRQAFRDYVASRDLPREFPGIRGFGFIERVQRGDVGPFVAALRADGAAGFELKTRGEAADLYVIKHVEPLVQNGPAWGFDVGAEPLQRAAVEQAIMSGRPTLSAPITLPQDPHHSPGFLLLLPVFRPGAVLEFEEDRMRHLIGLLYAPIVAEQLLAGVSDVAGQRLDVEVFAGPAANPANLVYDDDGHVAATAAAAAAVASAGAGAVAVAEPSRFEASRSLLLGGRIFTVRTRSLPAFDAHYGRGGMALATGAGLALSLLAAWGAWLLVSGRARVEARAQTLTADLARQARIVERTANAVLITDVQSRIVWVNDGFTRLSGYTLQEAAGRTAADLLGSGLTDPAVVEQLGAGVRNGTQVRADVLNRARDGHTYWLHVDMQPTFDAAGHLNGFMEIGTDISDRKAAEAALALERNWLAHIVAGTNAGEGEINVRTGELRISQRWAAMLGYTLDEMKPLARVVGTEIYHPDDLPGVAQAIRACTKGEVPHYESEFRMRHRDGRWLWIQARGSVSAWTADGRPEWLSGVNIDITERRRTTDELRESLALVDALFEAIPIPVMMKDTQGRFQRMNKAYATLFRTDAARLQGKTLFDLIDAETAQRYADEDRDLMAHRGSCSYELHRDMSDGRQFDALVSKATLIGPDGQVIGLVATMVDISQRMADAHAMAEAKAAAEAANQAKSAFLATMSHEIRTPMNGVVGMAELLTHSPLDDEQAQTVRTIVESGHALLGLIDDILDFSKIEAGRMDLDQAEFDITPLVEGVCTTLAPLAVERHVRLTVCVAAGVSERVLGDGLRVRQLLNNLIGNAIKFSARQDGLPGQVSVQVQLQAQAEGEQLRFCVSDNGIGMDQATIARLFTPFTQAEVSTTRRFGGTGLGLAICRRLVEMMGGQIEVHSTPGHGATFAFTLPLPAADVQPAAAPPLLGGLHCLLVPGPDLPAAQLRQWLEAAGAEVQAADSLAAAQQSAWALASPVIVLHADAAAALALPDTPGQDLRQLLVGYGRREMLRSLTPTVAGIDLLRREPLVRAVAMVAGRLSPDVPSALRVDLPDSARVPPPTQAQAQARGQLILVAEDDATNRAVLTRQLALLGHAAEFAHDGRQALACWRSGRHALLLTDLHMPEMDGYALAALIREEEGRSGRRRLPILALTANAMRGEAVRASAAGMDDYLTKPVPLPLLRAALNTWMPVAAPQAGRRPSDEPAAAAGDASLAAPTPPPVLNLQVLRELIGDDTLVMQELLADFRVSAQQHAADLQTALQAADAVAVSAVAHKLKSASRSVGALALAEVCATLEAAGLVGGTALAPQLGQRLAAEVAAAMAALQRHLAAVSA